MKKRAFLFSLLFFSISALLSSQISEKRLIIKEVVDSVGPELNALSDSNNFNILTIYNPGLNYWNPKPAIIGTEISGSFYNKTYPWMESYGVSLALYLGSNGTSFNKIHSSGELSSQYNIFLDKPIENSGRESNIYMAPGISLFSKNRKFSLGVYQMFSTQIFFNGNQRSVPVKANFHF